MKWIKRYKKEEKDIRYIMKKKIAMTIMGVGLLVLISNFFFSKYEMQQERNQNFDSYLNQLIYLLEKAHSDSVESEEMFQEDYLNRAKAIAYILAEKTTTTQLNNEMKELTELMEVDEIHSVSGKGIIEYSSDENSIGINFRETEQTREFLGIISSTDPNSYLIQLDGYSITKDSDMIYIGVKPIDGKKGMIQIGLMPERLQQIEDRNSISYVVNQIPTLESEAFFVVNKDSGELVGITENNKQILQLEKNKDLLEVLEDSYSGNTERINGVSCYLYTMVYGDYIVGGYIEDTTLYRNLYLHMMLMAIVIIVLSTILILRVVSIVNKHFVKEINQVLIGINHVLNGEETGQFKGNSTKEIMMLTSGLNKWVHMFERKSERMSQMTRFMGNDIATFEYSSKLNKLFLSDNIKDLLYISNEDWLRIKQHGDEFISYIKELKAKQEQSGDECLSIKENEYVEIHISEDKEVCYGVIKDVTDQMIEKYHLMESIKNMEQVAYVDTLTGLKNHYIARKEINEYLHAGVCQGVFLMIDLDNFKLVNDTLGHPEGDKLLQKFALCLKDYFRDSDLIARIGGDEFIVFLKGSFSQKLIEEKVERLLNTIRITLKTYYVKFKLSVSIGGVVVTEKYEDFESIYKSADIALYEAKRKGKDQFCLYMDDIECMHEEQNSHIKDKK